MNYFRSDVLEMQEYVPGEQPQAGKFIKLNTNENPYPPSPSVNHAIETVLKQGLQRYPDPVANAFRRRAAEVLGVDPSWVLCGNGSDEVLTMLMRAFVAPGDTVRFAYPSYVLYRTLAQIQGAKYQEIRFAKDWTLGDDFVAAADRLKLVLLPNPNSPSGTLISRSRILEMAEGLPCPLIVDEAYADFADYNCVDLVAQNEKIIVTRTLSKSYALAGLRFGFLVAQPHMVEQLMKIKDSYNVDALSIAGATAAIDDQPWLMDNVAKIKATRTRMRDALAELGFDVQPSQANFLWCTDRDRELEPIYQQLKSNRVLVRYMNYPMWGEGLRFSVGTDGQMDACLALLQSIV